MHLPLDLERKGLGNWKPTVIYLKNQFNQKLALANLQDANLHSRSDGKSSLFCEIFLLQNSPFLKYPLSLKLKKVTDQVLYQCMQFRFIRNVN